MFDSLDSTEVYAGEATRWNVCGTAVYCFRRYEFKPRDLPRIHVFPNWFPSDAFCGCSFSLFGMRMPETLDETLDTPLRRTLCRLMF